MAVKQQSTIHISLTPVLNDFVDGLVESGLYANISEVIREALREKYEKQLLQSQKQKKLQNALKIGLDEMEKGNFTSTDVENQSFTLD